MPTAVNEASQEARRCDDEVRRDQHAATRRNNEGS